MAGGTGDRVRDEVRVRMLADPVSVPAARRFVGDVLSGWQLAELAEDASLCVSELTSNAALHSASEYFEIVMDEFPGAVRICVDDHGTVPAAAVAPRAAEPDDGRPFTPEDLASTGRGLMIVSAVATDWGVEETPAGKRVWAELAYGEDEQPGSPAQPPPRPAVSPARGTPDNLPEGWHVVRLADCPVEMGLRQDRHLDELIRELQLADAGEDTPSKELAEVIAGLLHGQAHARHMGRRAALEAAAAGLEHTDIDMTMPAEAAEHVVQLHRAVGEADALCAQRELLTLASPPDVVSLREWMTHEIVHQIRYGEPPVPYAQWLQGDRA
jgi:anti-sigma regulatory factor (Ser/Thr protein kinase)